MSKGVGGPATMSSFRVQKAFSINFRENKRLRATLRIIEGDHMRSIRQVKQEITETKLWLKGVQENTGYSQHGIPNSEKHHAPSPTASRRMSIVSGDRGPTPRSPSRGRLSQPEVLYNQPNIDGNEAQLQDSAPPVRVTWTDQGPRRTSRDPSNQPPPPSTAGPETGHNVLKDHNRRHDDRIDIVPPLTAQPEIYEEDSQRDSRRGGPTLYAGSFDKKPRVHSAASGRSDRSLNTYQRRHILKSMVVKKQTPMESKKEIHEKECARVDKKIVDFLKTFNEWMKIPTPDISMLDFDPEKHDTPFAKDVNITV